MPACKYAGIHVCMYVYLYLLLTVALLKGKTEREDNFYIIVVSGGADKPHPRTLRHVSYSRHFEDYARLYGV